MQYFTETRCWSPYVVVTPKVAIWIETARLRMRKMYSCVREEENNNWTSQRWLNCEAGNIVSYFMRNSGKLSMQALFNLWHREIKRLLPQPKHFCFPTNFIFWKPDLPICVVATFLKRFMAAVFFTPNLPNIPCSSVTVSCVTLRYYCLFQG